jgi:hypothetical protein
MDCLTISLVRVNINGYTALVGRTASDRWNLMQFGVQTVAYDRNQADIKWLRRMVGSDFRVRVVKGGVEPATREETDAMGVGSRWITQAA